MVTVGDVLHRGRPVLAPDDTLLEAAHWMKHEGVSALPVCDGDRILGTLSDRDIVLRAVATGLDPATTQVRAAMQTELVWCYAHDTVEHAVDILRDRHARRILVVDEKKKLLGLLALEEMRTAQLAGEQPAAPGP